MDHNTQYKKSDIKIIYKYRFLVHCLYVSVYMLDV